jgi:ATP/maltotriose-dependent transcriptional regulator MalT
VFPAFVGGYVPEVRGWCDRVLDAGIPLSGRVKARLLAARGMSSVENDEFDALSSLLEEGLAAARVAEDRIAEETLILLRSMYWTHEQDLQQAQDDLVEALLLAGESGNRRTRLYALNVRAAIELAEGRLDEAETTNGLCLAESREVDCPPLVAQALVGLGFTAFVRGDLDTAFEHFRKTAALYTSLHPDGLALCLEGLGAIHLTRGDAARAAATFGAADVVRQAAGAQIWPLYRPMLTAMIDGTRQQLDPDTFADAWRSLRELPTREALGHTLRVDGAPPGRTAHLVPAGQRPEPRADRSS